MSEPPTPPETAAANGVTVSDHVVAKIAHRACSDVEGVHALGGGTARALAGLRGDKETTGVAVDVREGSVDVDVSVSIVFGSSVPAIAGACRAAVKEQVEATTGLTVRAVNVLVTDVVFPEEQADAAG